MKFMHSDYKFKFQHLIVASVGPKQTISKEIVGASLKLSIVSHREIHGMEETLLVLLDVVHVGAVRQKQHLNH